MQAQEIRSSLKAPLFKVMVVSTDACRFFFGPCSPRPLGRKCLPIHTGQSLGRKHRHSLASVHMSLNSLHVNEPVPKRHHYQIKGEKKRDSTLVIFSVTFLMYFNVTRNRSFCTNLSVCQQLKSPPAFLRLGCSVFHLPI